MREHHRSRAGLTDRATPMVQAGEDVAERPKAFRHRLEMLWKHWR
ncbi:MAG TPA: hypothetical protein VK442_01150 [Xanthobacteraceae bacterium]|nr:hypothetical protein [Xanthobacteraceae bacterium]